MFFSPSYNQSSNSGQTLIETLAAIFIMVMGITAAAGLAIYVFGTSTNIVKQIIATGLAREGAEAVKNMRDTNWLQGNLMSNCHDYSTGNNTAYCYRDWLKSYHDIDPEANTRSYVLTLDPASSKLWSLERSSSLRFGLNKAFEAQDVNGSNFKGFYYPETGLPQGNSEFYREIKLSTDTTGTYNFNEYPKLIVQSRVWWVDKKCPRVNNFDQAPGSCRVEVQLHLTNWKNY